MIVQVGTNANKIAPVNVRVNDGEIKPVGDASIRESSGGVTEAVRALPSLEEIKQAVTLINQKLQSSKRNVQLDFSIDSDTHKQVVKVSDTKTGEVIRQMPTEEMLAVARAIDQFQSHLFLDELV